MALVMVLAFGSFAAAQNAEDEEDEDAPPAQENVRRARIEPEQFDQWVFQGQNEQQVRNKLQSQLAMRINDIDRVSQLSKDQTRKLELAGRTDVKRLFDQVDVGRRKFEQDRQNAQNAGMIHRGLQPIRRLFSDQMFDRGSVFDKTVQALLTRDQLARYQQQARERKAYRQQAIRETILLALDKQIPLTEDQRVKLRELLADSRTVNPGPYESYAMWFAAAKLPAERYQAILTEVQWNNLQTRFAQMQNLEPFLRQNGALDDEEPPVEEAGNGVFLLRNGKVLQVRQQPVAP